MRSMDVKFQKKLIEWSFKAADDSEGVIEDIFVEQAARLQRELQLYLEITKTKKPEPKKLDKPKRRR